MPTGLRRLAPLWPVIALSLGPLLLFWPILFSHYTLYPSDLLNEVYLPFAAARSGLDVQSTIHNDFIRYYYPQRVFLQERLRAGELPLWNPYIMGGFPQFAGQGSLVTLDPFNLLLLFLELPRALAVRTALQVLCCGLSMYVYLRTLGLRRFPCWLGAQALELNSMFYASLFDWSPGSILWWPLVLACLVRAIGPGTMGWTAGAGLLMGIGLLASPLQMAAYMVFTIAGIEAVRAFCHGSEAGQRRVPWPAAAAIILGLLIASIQWLPACELFLLNRRPVGAEFRPSSLQWLLRLPASLTLLLPNLAGRLRDGLRISEAWASGQFYQGYFGLLPWMLALSVVAAGRDRRRWSYIVPAGVALVCLLTPLRRFLYDRFLIVPIFCGAALAALGAEAALEGRLRACRAVRLERALLALLMTVAAGLVLANVIYLLNRAPLEAWAEAELRERLHKRSLGHAVPLHLSKLRRTIEHFGFTSPAMLIPLLGAFAGVGLIRGLRSGRIDPRGFRWAALVLVPLDMVTTAGVQTPCVDLERHPLFPAHPLIERLRREPRPFRVLSFRPSFRDPVIVADNMWTSYQIESLTGMDNFRPLVLSALNPPEPGVAGDPAIDARRLGALGVRFVLAPNRLRLRAPGLRQIATQDGVTLYETTSLTPRAFLVRDAIVVGDTAEALRRATSSRFDPNERVLVDRLPSLGTPTPAAPARASFVRLRRYEPRRVELDVATPVSAVLVLADSWYPGWRVEVDGRRAEILRANAVMRGVLLPAGSHAVRFLFDPPLVRWGAWLSAAGTIVAVAILACGLHPRRLHFDPGGRYAAPESLGSRG